jgi:hypothetical protein
MSDTNLARSDVEVLAHRRRLAAARETRQTERVSLLQELIETEQRAGELREWIALREAKGEEPSPEIRRLIIWAKAALSGMESFLSPAAITRLLGTRALFPEFDDLADPLGEPPPRRPLGR